MSLSGPAVPWATDPNSRGLLAPYLASTSPISFLRSRRRSIARLLYVLVTSRFYGDGAAGRARSGLCRRQPRHRLSRRWPAVAPRWFALGQFVQFAVQGRDSAVPFTDVAFNSAIRASLAVSQDRSAVMMLVSAPLVGGGVSVSTGVRGRWARIIATRSPWWRTLLRGYPGAPGHVADGDLFVFATHVLQRFFDGARTASRRLLVWAARASREACVTVMCWCGGRLCTTRSRGLDTSVAVPTIIPSDSPRSLCALARRGRRLAQPGLGRRSSARRSANPLGPRLIR